MKHTTYRSFMHLWAPILEKKARLSREDYEVVCLIRDPMEWIKSWYRYRSRESINPRRARNSTRELTFADFVEAYLQDEPPPFARVGNPARFVSEKNGVVGVDRIFRLESLDAFQTYVTARLGKEIQIPRLNVSPAQETEDLPPKLHRRLQERLNRSISIYENFAK